MKKNQTVSRPLGASKLSDILIQNCFRHITYFRVQTVFIFWNAPSGLSGFNTRLKNMRSTGILYCNRQWKYICIWMLTLKNFTRYPVRPLEKSRKNVNILHYKTPQEICFRSCNFFRMKHYENHNVHVSTNIPWIFSISKNWMYFFTIYVYFY